MKIEEVVWQCLSDAVQRFNQSSDRTTLLGPRCENSQNPTDAAAAGERAITHRLAYYLEIQLRRAAIVSDHGPIVVDCEYNRHGSDGKSVSAEVEDRIKKIVKEARKKDLEADQDGFYTFSVCPDVLVHQRGVDANNLLIVELKKRSNRETEEYDELKLQLFTKSKTDSKGYGYKFGAWVVAEDKWNADERKLCIETKFSDGSGEPFNA